MAIGAVSPWAQTWPSTVAADGGRGGALVVLLAAVLLVQALLTGRRRRALSLASASAAWTAVCMYVAPGDLVDQGAIEATIAWGAYLALGGALLAIVATAWEPSSSAGRPGRGVLVVACLLLVSLDAVVGLADLSARSWSPHARDAITVMSSDGRARAVAAIAWDHGTVPSGLSHRGTFTRDSVVVAVRPVVCLWVDVHWDAPLESVRSTPGYLVRCRKPGTRKPPSLSLAGLGVTRRLLNSATISVCVSNAKAEGPRACGWQKVTYSPV
jgi:hypothetical protein